MQSESGSQVGHGRLTGGPARHDAGSRSRAGSDERDGRRRAHEHESRGGLGDGAEAALRAYYGNLRVGRARPR